MTLQEEQYMRGWSHAARMIDAGFTESECNALCGWMLGHINHDRALGFCAGVLSGYHEEEALCAL